MQSRQLNWLMVIGASGALATALLFACSGDSADQELPRPCSGCGGSADVEHGGAAGASGAADGSLAGDGGTTTGGVGAGGEGGQDGASNRRGPLQLTEADVMVAGTQHGDVIAASFLAASTECVQCHSVGATAGPFDGWRGSLMANSAFDPVFFASLSVANQAAPGVGSYCLRCHVPFSVLTGANADPTGKSLTAREQEGVQCHLCHAMIDPIYDAKTAVNGDDAVLAKLGQKPNHYGNAMFVLDPSATRRGPFSPERAAHPALQSSFVSRGDYCGTCHDAGNVLVSRRADGSYQYSANGAREREANENSDPRAQFPLLRTYTEWKLSAFANGGVDMQGRFAGDGLSPDKLGGGTGGAGGAAGTAGVGGMAAGIGGTGGMAGTGVAGSGSTGEPRELISTCQDCHMPQKNGNACKLVEGRPAVPLHEFAGAGAPILDMIAKSKESDPTFDNTALQASRDKAIAMLKKAVSLTAEQAGSSLNVRLYNETGHKLPTGHADARRVWLNVRLYAGDQVLKEYGAYNRATATLDEATTTTFELRAGLSPDAARITGQKVGETLNLALADVILKDTRIPPRGYSKQAYAAAGAGAIGRDYADGQYWSESSFALVPNADEALVVAYYQVITKEFVDGMVTANVTDRRGTALRDLFLGVGMAPPIVMASVSMKLRH